MKEFILQFIGGLLFGAFAFVLVFYELIREVILYCD